MKKNKRCNGHRLQLEPAAKHKEKQKVQQLATCNRRSRTANSTGPQVRRHRRQGLLWPQLEPDKRTKAQWLATCSRRTRTASSTGWWLFNVHPLHPFERRSAVTPILGGLQLRGSKRRRQLKTAKKNTKTNEISRRWQAFPEEVRARLPPRVCASSRPHFSAVARCPCSFEAEGAIRPLQVVVVVADNCLRGFATPPIG